MHPRYFQAGQALRSGQVLANPEVISRTFFQKCVIDESTDYQTEKERDKVSCLVRDFWVLNSIVSVSLIQRGVLSGSADERAKEPRMPTPPSRAPPLPPSLLRAGAFFLTIRAHHQQPIYHVAVTPSETRQAITSCNWKVGHRDCRRHEHHAAVAISSPLGETLTV